MKIHGYKSKYLIFQKINLTIIIKITNTSDLQICFISDHNEAKLVRSNSSNLSDFFSQLCLDKRVATTD